jgi:hypothetical protein
MTNMTDLPVPFEWADPHPQVTDEDIMKANFIGKVDGFLFEVWQDGSMVIENLSKGEVLEVETLRKIAETAVLYVACRKLMNYKEA